ncbi:MAG: hypothetical protein KatS3mg109_0033 [Pirellulaceae bacterium]|nr:MAG: hypothetical protein KatS3mg109_0033 [Pirellulaceae bacterium]
MSKIYVPELGLVRAIDEDNAEAYARENSQYARGYEGRDYSRYPYGSMPWGSTPFRTIPRSEWRERIEEGYKQKRFILHHQLARDVPILNQKRTPYCWVNAVVGAVMACRAAHGLRTVALSSASAGAPGKNYRAVGGWTGEAIGYCKRFGIVPQKYWPNDAIDRRYFEPTRKYAKYYNVGQWYELRPRKFDEVMTALLLGYPVTVGLNWWGHAVYYSAPVHDSGRFGVVITNSWGDGWEDGGRAVLMESKATPDEVNIITSPLMKEWRGDD